jgi:hypothetical protein
MASQPVPVQQELMRRLHGTDIYAGFVPTFAVDLQGWNSRHPAFEAIITHCRPSVIIDVGVWKGGSTIHLAELLMRHSVPGVVIGVDTFLGSQEHWDRGSADFGLIPRRHGMPLLYEQFLSNLVRTGVSGHVIPVPQTSTSACALLHRAGVRAGLIHIDASHDYEDVLRDALTYWEILEPGGYLVGDDYHANWPSVVKAADEFAAQKRLPLGNHSPKWIVRKPV